jgi:hypothetical protein
MTVDLRVVLLVWGYPVANQGENYRRTGRLIDRRRAIGVHDRNARSVPSPPATFRTLHIPIEEERDHVGREVIPPTNGRRTHNS